MAFIFKPSIFRDGTLYELPRPIPVVRVQDHWDYSQLKVPLAEGDLLVGHSQQGAEITLEGQVGTQGGAVQVSEAEMFATLQTLRAAVNVGAGGGKYELFLYHDAATESYRKFRGCSTVRFEFDISNPHLFTYHLAVHAEDPTISTTAPGV